MTNFKKVFNFKIIILLIAAIFLLNNICYGINLSQKSFLRKPLDFNGTLSRQERFQDVLRLEEQEQIKEMLRDPFLDLDEETIDFIVKDIARGGLFIDGNGEVQGSKSILRLMAEIKGVSMGDIVRESLFHEGVHSLLQLILYFEPKRLFLNELGGELDKGYSFKSASLKEDVVEIMEKYFGKFESENKNLEELIAKYYTYKFCNRDADIFNLPDMKRAGLIIEAVMSRHYYGLADDIVRTRKDLNSLFSVKGENTKKAQIAKLKELSAEAKEWGGDFKITFEQHNEAVAKLNKALGQLFLKKYPVILVLRRMRHGGSVADINTGINTTGFLEMIAEENEPWLEKKFNSLHAVLNNRIKKIQTLTNEPPQGIKINKVSGQILKWENSLIRNLVILEKIEAKFNELEKQIPYDNFNETTAEDVKLYSRIFKENLENLINILREGVDLVNGKVQKKEVSLNEIIKKTIDPYRNTGFIKFKEKGNPIIIANSMMMQQIITNIIVNSEKLKNTAGISEVVIAIRLAENGKDVIIEITDNGAGFPKEMRSNAPNQDGSYEVIFGLDASYRKDGSGFGLAENDFYARLHDGSFRIVSRLSGENRGSTFIIKLPVLSGINERLRVSPKNATAVKQIKNIQTSL
ncbi:MAG: hypothetical protein CO035_02240 [Candidatus Omnitrophica bacterium CG_4_9_14_0_2_um_filter_42_8]|nr:MAG: hypothetical protein COW92_04035 [Candidatus Omnitrophica bacterium CG22_combo_CG10-13_8_21_14_all_43_16]PJC48670.1 MAG: hypothetical protein CO035_02240 [Candidatus Omnitrophica bacterium CG_4_9_14_0_2_um_filter_42_8]